jgi:3-methylcrotonyl-CoA carboxylase alpha subunit
LNAPRRSAVRLIDDVGDIHLVNLLDPPQQTFSGISGDYYVAKHDGNYRGFEVYVPRGSGAGALSSGTVLSPMPGRIIAVEVAAGDVVTKGQKLVTLEAMKMEHSLTAPFDGVVAELNAEVGGQASEGMALVRIEATPTTLVEGSAKPDIGIVVRLPG